MGQSNTNPYIIHFQYNDKEINATLDTGTNHNFMSTSQLAQLEALNNSQ